MDEARYRLLDLAPIAISGERYEEGPPGKMRASLTIDVSSSELADDRCVVTASVDVERISDVANSEEEKSGLEYAGAVSYNARLDRPFDEGLSGVIVDEFWPFLRAALVEHARRLGLARMELPEALGAQQQYEERRRGSSAEQ